MNRKDLSLYIKKRRAIWLRCTVFWCRTIISQEEAEDILQEVICMLYEKPGVEKLIELMNMPCNNVTKLDYYVFKTIHHNCTSKSAPYYQQYHKISKKENLENSQLEKLVTDVYESNDTPDEKTDQEKIEMIKQIFNNLNMSERNRKLFIFHVFEGKEFSEWSGTETLQKLNNIVYEIKLRIRKELKKNTQTGG